MRAFILDRTLTPAIETFGAVEVRLLDPACGSGHFLIDGLKRLVAATADKHKDWSKEKVVAHALDRVVGIDLNDYACALARTRLIMTAAELAGVTKLADAARFHPHVYWADGLEQVEREEEKAMVQTDLFRQVAEKPRATLTRSDVRAALKKVFATKFHAVVANPPYITEKDAARKEYHREKLGKKQRYVSAYREYSLGSPFTERCFQLAENEGFVGIITGNNFMKRESGKPLIEKVLAGFDLSLVVDSSQAYIPFHGTPTVLLFGRHQRPKDDTVQVVMSKRRENGTPAVPANGKVWSSIADGWSHVGFENDYVSVARLPRATLSKHPWSLGGGGAAELKQKLDSKIATRLTSVVDSIGLMCITKQDQVFVQDRSTLARLGCEPTWQRFFPMGDAIRDWAIGEGNVAIFPYDDKIRLRAIGEAPGVARFMWPFRRVLEERALFGGETFRTGGRDWYAYGQIPESKFDPPLSIAFAKIATHNHFVIDGGASLFSDGSPIIKLPGSATEDEHFVLLGLLNSSIACFWMKQVFHPKSHASQHHHPDPARAVYEFAATGLQNLPVPDLASHRNAVITIVRLIDETARRRTSLLDGAVIDTVVLSSTGADDFAAKLSARWHEADALRERMVALQEELDWIAYVAYGLAGDDCLLLADRYRYLTCPRGSRPFERQGGRASTIRAAGRTLDLVEGEVPPVGGLPSWAEEMWARREACIAASADLQLVETSVFKRTWRDTEQNVAEADYRRRKDATDLEGWLANRIEEWAAARTSAFSLGQLVAALQDQPGVLLIAGALTGRPDFSLDALAAQLVANESMPQHRFHVYTDAGLAKRAAWEDVWSLQRREDAGERVEIPPPPEYSQGSRGKSKDFLRTEYWQLRGRLDVPKERFIAFTEVPGRAGVETLYGWAGWTAQQRVKAILSIDEELEDASVPLGDRIGLLDSAWRLLPDVAHEDAAAATRLKAELQALVGPEGPSRQLIDDWKKRFPPPVSRAAGAKRGAKMAAAPSEEEDENGEFE